jgi:hypothetical protein
MTRHVDARVKRGNTPVNSYKVSKVVSFVLQADVVSVPFPLL